MDVDLPGSYLDSYNSDLGTPIRKIRELNLNSPDCKSPVYPNIDDLSSPTSMSQSMVQKGYSQRLTNNVLDELNARASEISKLITSPPEQTRESTTTSRRHKRYSGIHRNKFNKMESISNHYSVTRKEPTIQQKERMPLGTNFQNLPSLQFNSPQKQNFLPSSPYRDDSGMMRVENITETPKVDTNGEGKRNPAIDISSASKRRRTLNGPEEMVQSAQPSSPERDNGSPSRRISPSKKSMNLNKLLNDGDGHSFAKPFPPSHKLRASSLEMAGVKPPMSPVRPTLDLSRVPALHLNSSLHPESSNLQVNNGSNFKTYRHHTPGTSTERSSNPSQKIYSSDAPLQKKSSIPQLQKKTSIPQLQNKVSNPQLQKKPSIPRLQGKTSIPQLQKKSSIPQLQKHESTTSSSSQPNNSKRTTSYSDSSSNRGIAHLYNRSVSSMRNLASNTDERSKKPYVPSNKNLSRSPSRTSLSSNQGSLRELNTSLSDQRSSKVTIPQPFSLYNKPTLSSTQKSLGRLQRFRDKFN